jgi:protein-tyrosine-phosphatase
VTVLEEHGIDGSRHVARQLTELMLANADLVLVATESVRRRVLTYENADEQKVRLMLGDVDLDDPWGMSLETYRSTARQLAPAIDELVAEMRGSS